MNSSGDALDKTALRKHRPDDGRLERSERTRRALITAYLELARRKKDLPTVAEVARQAGCSQRLVFERFESIGRLGLAVFDDALTRFGSRPTGEVLAADRGARIAFHVAGRTRLCENWLPLWRTAMRAYGNAPGLAARIAKVRELTRAELHLVYEPELSVLCEALRSLVITTLEALLDFECWGRLREHDGLSFEQARQVWMKGTDRLLPVLP